MNSHIFAVMLDIILFLKVGLLISFSIPISFWASVGFLSSGIPRLRNIMIFNVEWVHVFIDKVGFR